MTELFFFLSKIAILDCLNYTMYIFYSSYSSNITEVCNLKRVRVCVFLTSHSQTRFWNLLVENS